MLDCGHLLRLDTTFKPEIYHFLIKLPLISEKEDGGYCIKWIYFAYEILFIPNKVFQKKKFFLKILHRQIPKPTHTQKMKLDALSSLLWVVFFIAIPGKRFVWVNGSSKILEKEIEPNCVYVLSLHKWMFFKLWSKLLSVEQATFFKATHEWNSDIFITTGPGFILIGYFYNHRARFLRHLIVRSFFG